MTSTIARIKKSGKNFEIVVDLDSALKFKKGESNFIEADIDRVFTDSKKGQVASNSELQSAFGTNDVNSIIQKIVKEGEVQVTQEHRDAEQEKRWKQAIDFLANNAIDPKTGNPHTPSRIEKALEEARVNIRNAPIETQMNEIIEKISRVIPIKIETKKIRIKIPAVHTGKAYGIVAQYKQDERWLDDGSLEVVVSVPSGAVMDFYDKLNSVTHGSAITEEVKE
jgi:ribosome maturation protein SDO1